MDDVAVQRDWFGLGTRVIQMGSLGWDLRISPEGPIRLSGTWYQVASMSPSSATLGLYDVCQYMFISIDWTSSCPHVSRGLPDYSGTLSWTRSALSVRDLRLLDLFHL